MRGGDIGHYSMMKAMLTALVMMNIWMRMTVEVLKLMTELEYVIFYP